MSAGSGRGAAAERVRLDVWLWRARMFKTRSLAAAAVAGGKIRVNGERQRKPGHGLKLGDVLTISRPGSGALVLELAAFGERRGPAVEARGLYEALTQPETPRAADGEAEPSAKPGDRPDESDARGGEPPPPALEP